MNQKRVGISKRLRFEIFKRDSFKCQYCGLTAPEKILEIDHILPVSKGGTTDIINLITACEDCNAGKSDKLLTENAEVSKKRIQLEKLQEKREQLKMIFDWQQGLLNIENDTIESIAKHWHEKTAAYSISITGKNKIKKLLKKFTINEILEAINITASTYFKYENNELTFESAGNAFNKISGILNISKIQEKDPNIAQLYYIRGILRNRLLNRYFDSNMAIALLKSAYKQGVLVEELKDIALNAKNWSDFREKIQEIIDIDALVKEAFQEMNKNENI